MAVPAGFAGTAGTAGTAGWPPYAWAVPWCGGAVVLSALLQRWFDPVNLAMLFLAAVVAIALRHGRGPAALGSVVSVAAFDFFFVPPFLSFDVGDAQYLLTFAVMLAVGLVIGHLTAGLREQAAVARRREAEACLLYALASELSGALAASHIVEICGRFLRSALDAEPVFFLASLERRLTPAAGERQGARHAAVDAVLAQWVFDHGQPAGIGTATLAGNQVLYLPLKAPTQVRGVLALAPRAWPPHEHEALRRQAEVFAALIAVAVERVHYVDVAQQAQLSMETERLRGSLLAAVSHDLRTPLTTLIGLAETLQRSQPPLAPSAVPLVAALREQAMRMRTMVVNLLDMARLQTSKTRLRREWQSIEELVGAALAAMREALARHRIVVSDLSALPLVECDAVLMERVLCNLLENAAKYAQTDTTIRIGGTVAGDRIELFVEDEGPGVPADMARRIFGAFMRGERESAMPGVGLGLAVSEAIVAAHGGGIRVQPVRDGGAMPGARFVVSLPRGTAPTIEPEPPWDEEAGAADA